MDVFLSWSKPRSHELALALRNWLPEVMQTMRPWVSSEDIDKGQRWIAEVAARLDETSEGVVCVTPENVAEPWLNFEAGALAKSVKTARVRTLLLGVDATSVTGPMAQFQATRVDSREDMAALVRSLNKSSDRPLEDDRLTRAFDRSWADFEGQIEALKSSPPEEGSERPGRSLEDMVAEILELVRGLDRGTRPSPGFTDDFIELMSKIRHPSGGQSREVEVGNIVVHRKLGIGKVLEVSGEPGARELIVEFVEAGKKRMLESYAALTVLADGC